MLGQSPLVAFIPTADPERARSFYEDHLGLLLVRDDGFALVFDAQGVMLRVVSAEGFTPQPFTILGWEVSDIASTLRALQARGVEAVRYDHFEQNELGVWTAPGGDRVAWIHDPDGNLLSLSQHVAPNSDQRAPDPKAVLDFWLGALDDDGLASPAHAELWWKKDESFDESIRVRFALTHARAVAGKLDAWTETPRGRLALVVVLDQFSRNMFRGRPGMFAADGQAVELVRAALGAGLDAELETDERVFLYLPLMHSELLDDQDRCVARFEELVGSATPRARQRLEQNLAYAIAHRDVVARFGRFPHRNTILDRKSTQAEREFLQRPGSSF